jgi:GNAT superfamily N-acetyltransferase
MAPDVIDLPKATIAYLTFDWWSQVSQFVKQGKPGITLESPETPVYGPDGHEYFTTVDCLLYRNRKGALVGILYHYNDDTYDVAGNLVEKKGNVNVMVRPSSRRAGVGTRLVRDALARWDIDLQVQQYTDAGRALFLKVLEGIPRNRVIN